MKVFEDRVEPLEVDNDSPFCPIDMSVCVKKLGKLTKKGSPPDPKQLLNEALVNYLQLYFPSSLSPTDYKVFGRDSRMCFVKTKLVEGETKFFCLACGWQVYGGIKPLLQIRYHLSHQKRAKRRCPSITKWMVDHLSAIEKCEFDLGKISTGYLASPTPSGTLLTEEVKASRQSGHDSCSGTPNPAKKGKSGGKKISGLKTPGVLPNDASESSSPSVKGHKKAIAEPCVPLLSNLGYKLLTEILGVNGSISEECGSVGTEAGQYLKDLFLNQELQLHDIIGLFTSCRVKGTNVDGTYVVDKAVSFLGVLARIRPFKQSLPEEISVLIEKMSGLVYKLYSIYLEAESVPKAGDLMKDVEISTEEAGKEDAGDSSTAPDKDTTTLVPSEGGNPSASVAQAQDLPATEM